MVLVYIILENRGFSSKASKVIPVRRRSLRSVSNGINQRHGMATQLRHASNQTDVGFIKHDTSVSCPLRLSAQNRIWQPVYWTFLWTKFWNAWAIRHHLKKHVENMPECANNRSGEEWTQCFLNICFFLLKNLWLLLLCV